MQFLVRGIKTSEFWLNVVVLIVIQLNTMGVFPKSNDTSVTSIAMVLASVIYTIVRSIMKTENAATSSVPVVTTLQTTSEPTQPLVPFTNSSTPVS